MCTDKQKTCFASEKNKEVLDDEDEDEEDEDDVKLLNGIGLAEKQ